MAETTMEPWSFTIVFDEDKAKKNGYEVDTLYDYVGKNVEGLGYLLVFLGELGILDGKLVDERGERGGICRIGLFCRISGVFLGGIRAYCSFNDFGCRLSFGFGNISYSICGFLLDSICSRNL